MYTGWKIFARLRFIRAQTECVEVMLMAYRNRGKKGKNTGNQGGEEIIRVPLPDRSKGQLFGVIEQALGAGWMDVRCEDGKVRRCRIPGKLKRRMWMRVGDVVIVQPWPVQTDERGDIVYRYTRTQVDWLLRKGKISQDFLTGGELLF